MPVFIPEPVQEVLDCIAEMNIRTTTKHKITSITEIYTQQWKPQNLQTLVAFLRANIPGIPFVTDEELILHINETGKEVLKKHKESEAFRNRYGLVIFFGFFGLTMLISLLGAGKYSDFVPLKMYWLSFALAFIVGIISVVQKVMFPEIAKHLKDDALTIEDCTFIMKELPKKKILDFEFLRYGIIFVLICLTLLMVSISGKINKSAFDKQYSEITEGYEENIQEIDRLIADHQFSEAWKKSEECSLAAYEMERKVEEYDDSIDINILKVIDAYESCQEKIVRTFVCGFWIGNSTNPSYPYVVYYVTESDNGYWTFMTDKEYSLEEVAQIVESYRSEYFIPAKTVEISKGSKKAVTFFTEASGLDLCLECTSFPEESLTIGECEFTRID